MVVSSPCPSACDLLLLTANEISSVTASSVCGDDDAWFGEGVSGYGMKQTEIFFEFF